MTSVEYFAETVKLLWKAVYQAEDAVPEDFTRWFNILTEAIPALDVLMLKPALSRAERQRCESYMRHLLFIKERLSGFLRVGGELQQEPVANQHGVNWHVIRSAFSKRIRTGVIVNRGHLDITSFMNDARTVFEVQIKQALTKHSAIKVNTELSAEFIIPKNGEETVVVKYFNTKNVAIYQTTNVLEWFDENVRQPIMKDMEEFQERDSGWSLKSILGLSVNINQLNPLKGSSYIPLPQSIVKKKACVNVKNEDNRCFKWAILSALFPVDAHADRVSSYQDHANDPRFNGLQYPVQPKDISKFEKSSNISINLYMMKRFGCQFQVSPCHVTTLKRADHVNLLLVQDFYIDESIEESMDDPVEDDDDDQDYVPKFHYVWIKNMSRLIKSQLSTRKNQCYICDRCLHYFWTNEKLEAHEQDCSQLNQCRIDLPSNKDCILKFENHDRSELVPFVIYADLESLLKPVEDDERITQEHEAYSIGFYVKCSFDDNRSTYRSFRKVEGDGPSPANWFVEQLQALSADLEDRYQHAIEMRLSDYEEYSFYVARYCHICRKPFKEDDTKVRDHCHLTGRFRGAAHDSCNLNYQGACFIPIVFHNLTGYDSHFIIKEVATAENFEGRVRLLAENKEKYISFSKFIDGSAIHFRFIDSFRFMPSSLDKLSSYLEQLDIAQREFENDDYTPEQIQLLRRKGVFPYEFVSSLDKLEQQQLPAKEDFHSRLTNSDVSDADYEHAQNVWHSFNVRDLGEYSDLYLKTDVLLLADVFESFRRTCIEAYQLDPAHYYTTPGLTWDAMLKCTDIKLELLTDIDMVMFVEKGIRGGISQCSNRYGKANNPYMGENYNKDEETKYLMYYDVNNLYGWAMTQSLPYADFEWVENVDMLDFNVPDDNPIGYVLEVDLEYPEELHDAHKDLPLCPEHRAPPGSKQKKLLTTLFHKERYVIHYRALKQALANGLRLRKIHRVMSFKQEAWLKPYVDLNTERRKQARNEFEKLFYKLMINAVYGKTMECERKRVDVKLVNKWEGRYGAEARIAAPNFHSCSIFDENLVAIQLAWTTISISKPIYIGLCVLDLSKILVYDFHYGFMKETFGDRCKLLYTDTDSLVYETKKLDIYAVMRENIDKFDTSDYPEDNRFGLPRVNKKVLGVMKDECAGKIMLEFIGLRSKMYSIRIQDQIPIKKAKGVKAHTVKNTIGFEDYRRCLEEEEIIRREQFTIRSRLHKVRTEREHKVALSPHDDKRCLIVRSPDTLPWGHYRIVLPTSANNERGDAAPEERETATAARVRGVGDWLQKRRAAGQNIIRSDSGSEEESQQQQSDEPSSKRLKLQDSH